MFLFLCTKTSILVVLAYIVEIHCTWNYWMMRFEPWNQHLFHVSFSLSSALPIQGRVDDTRDGLVCLDSDWGLQNRVKGRPVTDLTTNGLLLATKMFLVSSNWRCWCEQWSEWIYCLFNCFCIIRSTGQCWTCSLITDWKKLVNSFSIWLIDFDWVVVIWFDCFCCCCSHPQTSLKYKRCQHPKSRSGSSRQRLLSRLRSLEFLRTLSRKRRRRHQKSSTTSQMDIGVIDLLNS